MNILQRIGRKLAHAIGWLRLRLGARWIPPLGGFLLTIVLVGVVDFFFAKTSLPPFTELNKDWHHKLGDWLNIWTILAIYTIAWLLIWSVRASNGMGDAQTTNREKAIEILREAARLEALPEIYLHLAQACQNQLTYLSDASEKLRLLANIRAYCQHAHDLNGDNDTSLSLQLDDLLKSLPT